jgi:hypothetical protein
MRKNRKSEVVLTDYGFSSLLVKRTARQRQMLPGKLYDLTVGKSPIALAVVNFNANGNS